MAEKEKCMIFTAESVRAMLGGMKSQTRRVVKPHNPRKAKQFEYKQGCGLWIESEYIKDYSISPCWIEKDIYLKKYAPCKPGDIIYAKEVCALINFENGDKKYWYKADISEHLQKIGNAIIPWRSPRHMPKAAARIFLRVTDVRVERLQEISEADAIAEGMDGVEAYRVHWDEINGKRDKGAYKWDMNPWVWVYTFERILNYEY